MRPQPSNGIGKTGAGGGSGPNVCRFDLSVWQLRDAIGRCRIESDARKLRQISAVR
jgi:hypothetical protein